MFLGLLDSDQEPLVRCIDPDLSFSKNSKKNLDFSFLFCDFFDFLSMKSDVNVVPSKSNMQKNSFKKICFLLAS
jgi:hypothetical protein